VNKLCCLIIAFGCWLTLTSSLIGQSVDDTKPKRPKSLLDELADSQKFFKLLRKGTGLAVEAEADPLEFKPLATQLRALSEGSSSGSSNSSRLWSKQTNGHRMSAKFARGDIKTGWSEFPAAELPDFGFAVQITENQSPYCKVKMLTDFESNEIQIRFSRQSDNFAFNFAQSKDGKITVQEISTDDVFAVAEKDFVTFQQKHGKRLTQSIAEMLSYLRVDPPASKYSDVVVRRVLNRLQPVDPQIESEFQKIVEELTGGKFAEREAKSKQLLSEYDKWQKYIHTAARSEEIPAETRSRLRKIIEEAASQTQKQEFELLLNSKLEGDPEYLVWLLENRIVSLTAEDRKNVFDNLRSISKQSIADETLAWKRWLATTVVPEPKRDYSKFSSDIRLDNVDGPLNRLTIPISELVKLKFDAASLAIDKQKWAELYRNKKTPELISDARNYMQQNNLPSTWLKVGGFYTTESTGYSQLLFENLHAGANQIESDFAPTRNRARISRGYERIAPHSRNREFVNGVVSGRLRVHEDLPFDERKLIVQGGDRIVNPTVLNTSEPPIAEQFFQLSLSESVTPFRSFLIATNPIDGFRLRIEFGLHDGFISLVESKIAAAGEGSEWRLVDVRGNDVFVTKAPSLNQMMAQNQPYFSTQLAPILGNLGIQWPDITAQK